MSVKTKQHHLTENDRKIHDVGAKYYSTTYLRMYPPDQKEIILILSLFTPTDMNLK